MQQNSDFSYRFEPCLYRGCWHCSLIQGHRCLSLKSCLNENARTSKNPVQIALSPGHSLLLAQHLPQTPLQHYLDIPDYVPCASEDCKVHVEPVSPEPCYKNFCSLSANLERSTLKEKQCCVTLHPWVTAKVPLSWSLLRHSVQWPINCQQSANC